MRVLVNPANIAGAFVLAKRSDISAINDDAAAIFRRKYAGNYIKRCSLPSPITANDGYVVLGIDVQIDSV